MNKNPYVLDPTPEMKELHWGPGEWVNEPNSFSFESDGFKCHGQRVSIWDGPREREYLFGGHWCAYIDLPENHPWHGKKIGDLDIDCHGGITFSAKNEENNDWVIGLDCAHSEDFTPSMDKFFEKYESERKTPYLEEMKNLYPNCALFDISYRNIDFVISQCKYMAEQALKDSNEDI